MLKQVEFCRLWLSDLKSYGSGCCGSLGEYLSLNYDHTNPRPTLPPASNKSEGVNQIMLSAKKRNGVRERFNHQKSQEPVMKAEEYLDKLRRLQVDMNTLQKITMRQVETITN
jgi:hypothetical protein